MKYTSLNQFLAEAKTALAKGPLALVFAEDAVEVDTTIRHHLEAGFVQLALFAPDAIPVAAELEAKIHRIPYEAPTVEALVEAVNKVIAGEKTTAIDVGGNCSATFGG